MPPLGDRWSTPAIVLSVLLALGLPGVAAAESLADLVDPTVGLRRGSTVIGPTLPRGSAHPSPDTREGGHAGYKPDRPVRGFSQLHATGTGWGQYGNVLVSPQVGLDLTPDGHDSDTADERATAYAYQVRLTKYDVLTRLTPTRHGAAYAFTFPSGEQSHVVFDLAHQVPGGTALQMTKASVVESDIAVGDGGRTLSGHSAYRGGWGGGPIVVYFVAEFDQPPAAAGTWKNGKASDAKAERLGAKNDRVGGWCRFVTTPDRPVRMRIGVSFRSVDKARQYLRDELPGWDVAAVERAAKAEWDKALGRIVVEGGDARQRKQFYTALYHAQIMPRDRTGEFARFAAGAPMYDDHYAIWDTWRTAYPLMTLIDPAMVRGTVRSFIERLRVDRYLRDSMCGGNSDPKAYNDDQGGNNLDNIIADAFVKGVTGVDWEKAYAVLKHDADTERAGLVKETAGSYRKQGWIPNGKISTSATLEYAYNDFCAAEVAAGLGKTGDAQKYLDRSKQWRRLFNPDAESDGFKGFVMVRNPDGTWADWADPKKQGRSWVDPFYEGNSWTYTFFVPHDVAGLIDLTGGREAFARRLEHGDGKRLIDYGNEPAFLAPFLGHYAGRPDLGSKMARELVRTQFKDPRDPSLPGYPGDDDSGAMSSYLVWVSLGLFPNAGQDVYLLTAPTFPTLTVHRPEDAPLVVTAQGEGDYVAAVTLNGKPLDRCWLRHGELAGPTTLAFTLSRTPTAWGRAAPPPPSMTLPAPPRK